MGQSKIGKNQKEAKSYIEDLYFAMVNIIFHLIRLMAPFLTQAVIESIVKQVMSLIMERLKPLVEDYYNDPQSAFGTSQKEEKDQDNCQ